MKLKSILIGAVPWIFAIICQYKYIRLPDTIDWLFAAVIATFAAAAIVVYLTSGSKEATLFSVIRVLSVALIGFFATIVMGFVVHELIPGSVDVGLGIGIYTASVGLPSLLLGIALGLVLWGVKRRT